MRQIIPHRLFRLMVFLAPAGDPHDQQWFHRIHESYGKPRSVRVITDR
jgi:hypothetical protein